VITVEDTLSSDEYDEFGLLHENASEWGIAGPLLKARREVVEVAPGQVVSAIVWGEGSPEIVFLHGGGQNAHTWDTLALVLGRSAVAIDLPGHGRSSRRADRNYGPWCNTEALEVALPMLAPDAAVVVGMSLGGATLLRLAAVRPDLARAAVIVDVTPQVNDPTRAFTTEERGSVALIGGPPTYPSFAAMADATVALSPHRAPAAVRRGVRHNATRLDDGTWRWRYDLFGERDASAGNWSDFVPLWSDVNHITVPTMLVRGGESKFVTDADAAEMRRRLPSIRIETVAGAGHAVQSDRPLDLVTLIDDFAFER
jgi:pimeloyl-ACP methyl ester carboxylesterase